MAFKNKNKKESLEGAVIVATEAKDQRHLAKAVSQPPSEPKLPKKRRWGWLITLLAVLVVGGGVYWFVKAHHKKPAPVAAINVCNTATNGAVLSDAANNLDPAKVQQLQPDVMKIQTLPNYDKDPNCLYPVVTYYINISDATNAQKYLDLLTRAYDPKVGYTAGALTIVAQTPDKLRTTVQGLQANQKSLNSNGYGVGPDGTVHREGQ